VTGPTKDQADVAIIMVSTNEAKWLEPALSTVFAHAGDAKLDVVVVDNESTDGTRELVESKFPAARVVDSQNKGFAHANNRGAETCTARYVLFLNPDAEAVKGLGRPRGASTRPDVGMAGVKQLTGDCTLWPTIRYSRVSGAAKPSRPSWTRRPQGRERARPRSTDRGRAGPAMFCRREALPSAAARRALLHLPEEPDLCLRSAPAGPPVTCQRPSTTRRAGRDQDDRPGRLPPRQYANKHQAPHRAAYLAAVGARHRRHRPGVGRPQCRGSRLALRTRGSRSPAVGLRRRRRSAARARASCLLFARSHPFGWSA
jgi:GT2 family glycosyltransferase